MILDSMTKYEVIVALRKDFENEVLPYYYKNRPKYRVLIESKAKRRDCKLKRVKERKRDCLYRHTLIVNNSFDFEEFKAQAIEKLKAGGRYPARTGYWRLCWRIC